VLGIFKIGSPEPTVCPGWLPNMILLISASQVARIIGVSHQHMAQNLFYSKHRKIKILMF
jgi:hypothetical protein